VHRHNLYQGLAEGARRHGVNIIDARVNDIDYQSDRPVKVRTYKGDEYKFDLPIRSDGLKSIVRKALVPDVKLRAPTTNAAYRYLIPYSEVFANPPDLKEVFGNIIDVWLTDKGYAISYPFPPAEIRISYFPITEMQRLRM